MREQKEAARKEAQALADKHGALEPLSEETTYIHKLTIPQLRDILKSLAPTVLSIGALSQHARSLQKSGLLEILEYVTGYVPETPLYPTILCRQALLKRLQRAALVRGDRALKLALPPAWSLNGLFRITAVEGGKIEVGHRFTLQRLQIDVQDVVKDAALFSTITIDTFVVNFNFSELKACIAVHGEVQGVLLSTIFKSHAVVKDELEQQISPESIQKRRRGVKLEDFGAGASSSPSTSQCASPPEDVGNGVKDEQAAMAENFKLAVARPVPAAYDDGDAIVPAPVSGQ